MNLRTLIVVALALGLASCSHQAQSADSTSAAEASAAASATPESTATPEMTPSPEATASSEAASSESPPATPGGSAAPVAAGSPVPACSPGAGQITATYFTLPEKHPDVAHDIDGSIVPGLVEKGLGPNGFPLVSPTGRTGKQVSGPITDVDAAGEIMWWSTAGTHGVKLEKTVTECLPIDNNNMFADGYTDDGTVFLAAHYQGYFDVPSATTVGLSEGSDDDSWVYIDGNLVVDNGGVKPRADAPYTSMQLSPGRHTLEIFYADRHSSDAELGFDPKFAMQATPPSPPASVSSSPSPEPTASPAPTAKPAPAALESQFKKQKRIRIYGIHFDVDKATIQPKSETVIAEIASVMRDNPTWRFRVEGHTDSDGGYEHNVALSQARAEAVVNDLVTRYHIARSRLEAAGYWYSRPVAPNDTPEHKALNRRVELVLL